MMLFHSFVHNAFQRLSLTCNRDERRAGASVRSIKAWRRKGLRSTVAALAVFSGTVATVPNALAWNSYDYKGVCPSPSGGRKILDKWYMWTCECTSYAADKLNERGVSFRGGYKNVKWGSAGNWLAAAKATATPYSMSPRRGDVAWWASGHVASVDAVDSYGNVTISEYNWGNRWNYHTRTIKRGTASFPNYFIHF